MVRGIVNGIITGSAIFLFLEARVCAQVLYSAVKLKTPVGTDAGAPQAMSPNGSAGGLGFVTSTGPYLPAIWNEVGDGRLLATPFPSNGVSVLGFDVASVERAVGVYRLAGADYGQPVVWEPDKIRFLTTANGFGAAREAAGDLVVGVAATPTGSEIASIWRNSEQTILHGLPGSNSFVNDVNRHGVYVGQWYGTDASGNFIRGGFIGENGNWRHIDYPGFDAAGANDINDHNRMAGVFFPPGSPWRTAFVAQDDWAYALDPLPGGAESWAGGINNDGTVVGRTTFPNFSEVATIWPPGSSQPIDLNTLVDLAGIRLVLATEINHAGQILVEGIGPNNTGGWFFLTPIPESGGAMTVAGFVAAWALRPRAAPRRQAMPVASCNLPA